MPTLTDREIIGSMVREYMGPSASSSYTKQAMNLAKYVVPIASAMAYSAQNKNISNNKMPQRRGLRGAPKVISRQRPIIKSTKKSLVKQVKDLKKSVQSDQAYHTHRQALSYTLSSSAAQIGYQYYNASNVANMEASLAYLRYYDPSVPGTLTTANASTGTYSRVIHFASVNGKIEVRNNYQVPCKVRVYVCTPKQDTNINPNSYFSDGVTDQVVSGSANSPLLFPTDIDLLTKAYTLKLKKSTLLEPGKQFTASHTVKDIDYDPSMYDTHSLSYQRKYKHFVWFVRVEGVLGHDTVVTTEQALLPSQVDIQTITTYKIIYDAGVNLNDYSYTDSRDATFTNGGVVSNKPVSDNQSLSLA